MTSKKSTKQKSFKESRASNAEDKNKSQSLTNEQLADVIEKAPKKEREKILSRVRIQQETSFSGPIPPPHILEQFNEVIPSGAERIMKMAENQSEHRMELEKSTVNAKNRDSLLGVIFAGLIGLIGLIGGLFLIYSDKYVSGFIFSSSTLGTLVGVYLRGTHLDKKDLQEKDDKS